VMATTQPRARRTGRYTYRNFDMVCAKCGLTLGVHEAEAPHAQPDSMIGPIECDGFRPVRVKLTAEQRAAILSLMEDSGYTRREARALVLAGGGVL
jgi:hypothetical protein